MYILQPPSWSYSQFNSFQTCKRCFFYDRYWSVLPEDLKWTVFGLKYITNISMLKGSCIHNALKSCILDYKHKGNKHSLEYAIYLFKLNFRKKYNESAEGHWKNPNFYGKKLSTTTNLFEHYYNVTDPQGKAILAEASGEKSLKELWTSPIWQRVFNTKEEDFVTVDEDNFPNFNIVYNGVDIKVYSVIDLAIKYNDVLRIIDWKTGKKVNTSKMQLAVYSMYAQEVWKYNLNKIKFYMTYLGDNCEIVEEKIDPVYVLRTKETIIRSFWEVLELFNNGQPNIENYEKTKDTSPCNTCKYRKICLKEEVRDIQLSYLKNTNF